MVMTVMTTTKKIVGACFFIYILLYVAPRNLADGGRNSIVFFILGAVSDKLAPLDIHKEPCNSVVIVPEATS